MSQRVHYNRCPSCHNMQVTPLFTVKDHSVSGEDFEIWQCAGCTLRFTQNVPNETAISPYYKSADYISHTNTTKGFINNAYQKVRTFTLKLKGNIIKKHTGKQKGKLLDVGAGTGSFLHHMFREGWQVTGIEPDPDARAVASATSGLELDDAEALQTLPQASFDAITLWHVLEHVHDLNNYMGILKSLLQPDGKLFIAVPNYQSYDANVYQLHWAAYDVPRHLYHFSPKAISVLAQRNGLKIVAQKPMWFDAFYISLLSSKYKRGKTNYAGALAAGLQSNVKAMLNKERCSSLIYIIEKA